MLIEDYCKKYGVTDKEVLEALEEGHLRGELGESGWWVKDEQINPKAEYEFHVEYVSSTVGGTEYSELDCCSSLDDAVYECETNGWVFETGCHGHDSWEGAMRVSVE